MDVGERLGLMVAMLKSLREEGLCQLLKRDANNQIYPYNINCCGIGETKFMRLFSLIYIKKKILMSLMEIYYVQTNLYVQIMQNLIWMTDQYPRGVQG